MTESWKRPEEENMSIGELIEMLQATPKDQQHIPVKLTWEGQIFNVNKARFSFTDGKRYFSEQALAAMRTFEGIYLEIYADHM